MPPSQLDRIEKRIEDIHEVLHGDGSDGNPGLKIKVDRLVQDANRRGWMAKTALGAAIAALLSTIGKWITLHH